MRLKTILGLALGAGGAIVLIRKLASCERNRQEESGGVSGTTRTGMPIEARCALCGAPVSVREGEGVEGRLRRAICQNCASRISESLLGSPNEWDGIERRTRGARRRGERRYPMRYAVGTADTLVVIDGITWIDNRSSSQRQRIRRRHDREWLAKRIRDGVLSLKQAS